MTKHDLESMSILGVLGLHADTMAELNRRGITRSGNGPVANYAEHLVCKALSLAEAKNSTKGYDATDAKGKRYEIKARRQTACSKPTRFSAIRDFEEHHFDFLVAILFAEDFRVKRAAVLPRATVQRLAFRSEHVNGWIVPLRDSLWNCGGAKGISESLRREQDKEERPKSAKRNAISAR